MKAWIRQLWRRHHQLILYVFYGNLTFLIDTGLFFILSYLLHLEENFWLLHSCSIVSTMAAITFAYITNRKYVFRSKVKGKKAFFKEMTEFYSARIATMLVAELMLQILVVDLGISAHWMKLLVNILVVVLNYLFSKFWIFKRPKKKPRKR